MTQNMENNNLHGINVRQRFDVFARYHPGLSRRNDIDTITIHGSAGSVSAQALFNWFRSLESWLTFEGDTGGLSSSDKWSHDKARRLARAIGFYHYIIDRQGEIYHTLDENKWSYHSHAGRNDDKTIAVCLINPERGNASEYTDQQYHSLHMLIYDILDRREALNRIDSHVYRASEFSKMTVQGNGLTPCPGEKFHWELIQIFNDRVSVLGVV